MNQLLDRKRIQEWFQKIFVGIGDKLNSPEGKISRESVVAGVTVADPVAGAFLIGTNVFLEELDEFKLNRLLLGLSTGLNQEIQLNELYNYVVSSGKRAFLVGNVFKQTLASNSSKTCVLYGKILSDHIGENKKDFTRDELIVCNALVNASDYDLKSFKTIMKERIITDSKGIKRIEFKKTDDENSELQTTCSWGTYNRLFSANPTEILDFEEVPETISVKDINYHVEQPAEILIKWIEEIQQIWDYDK